MIQAFCSTTSMEQIRTASKNFGIKYENIGFYLQIVLKNCEKLRATMASEHHGMYKYTVTNLQISCFLIINFIVVSDDAQAVLH